MAASPQDDDQAADNATRLSRRFLASLRKGDIDTARIQISALNDITPREPWFDLNELHTGRADPRRTEAEGERTADGTDAKA